MAKLGRDGTAGSSTGGSRASISGSMTPKTPKPPRSSITSPAKPEKGQKGALSVSTRKSELDSGTKKMVKKQNKAAESYKIKDMDAQEMNKIKYQAALKKKAADLRASKISGFKAGAAVGGATVGATAVGVAVVKKDKKKPSTKNK